MGFGIRWSFLCGREEGAVRWLSRAAPVGKNSPAFALHPLDCYCPWIASFCCSTCAHNGNMMAGAICLSLIVAVD